MSRCAHALKKSRVARSPDFAACMGVLHAPFAGILCVHASSMRVHSLSVIQSACLLLVAEEPPWYSN
jgi:hypothetical protein